MIGLIVAGVLTRSPAAFAADITPPASPGLPLENSATVDADYDGNGAYAVYWPSAADSESGIAAYEVQEQVDGSGIWMSLTTTRTSPNFSVSGRVNKTAGIPGTGIPGTVTAMPRIARSRQ